MSGFACIGLDNPKFAVNVGAALRAASCYGVSLVALSGPRCRRWVKSSANVWHTHKRIPTIVTDDLRFALPYDCVPVAVELAPDAAPLFDYEHPRRAFYVFGGEDNTLGRRVLSWCAQTIYVPTNGCMNLAACVNVVLYDRAAKEHNDAQAKRRADHEDGQAQAQAATAQAGDQDKGRATELGGQSHALGVLAPA
jgi:tRNA(Leu) C34 or U34 (ribose-2'-O)-methylase TrmL